MTTITQWLLYRCVATVCAAGLMPALAQADPAISGIVPAQGPPRSYVTIQGSGFGDAQGTSYVLFAGRFVPVLAWTPGAISIYVDPLAFDHTPIALDAAYPVKVVTQGGSKVSNALDFTLNSGRAPVVTPTGTLVGSPDQPTLQSFNRPLFCPGDMLSSIGTGYGATQGDGFVSLEVPSRDAQHQLVFRELAMPVLAWSENAITTVLNLPADAEPGGYSVTIHRANGKTAGGSLSVGAKSSGSCVIPTPAISLSTRSLSFPTQLQGTTSAEQSLILTNIGLVPLTLINVTFNGVNQHDFAFTGGDNHGMLAPGESRIVTVVFKPSADGIRNARVDVITDAATNPDSVVLDGMGKGIPAVNLSTHSLDFGSQPVGTASGEQSFVLTNTGTGPLTLINVTFNGADYTDYAFTGGDDHGTLAAGESRTVTLVFKPQLGSIGSRTARVDVVTDAASSPDRVALTGSGDAEAAAE